MNQEDIDARRTVKFDGTISLGTIITVVSVLAGGIWFASQSDAKLRGIDTGLNEVKASIDRLTLQTNSSIERIDRRIDYLVRQPQRD